ncbi:hypothetical protein [Kitasatospora sp. MBT66]|uniref:hypothetical protein n=1 Tax=Kitasatospora sp. MBT66 TaxID=1444769 RepID=UPI0005BC4FC1|nr:hypothetical protein [Kitasatospora sp. MBT66]
MSHSGQFTRPAPLISAATRFRSRWSTRHCLARHVVEQYTALGRDPGLSRTPQPSHFRSPTGPLPSDTSPG